MNLRQALEKGGHLLKKTSVENPLLEARLLLCELLSLSMHEIVIRDEQILSLEQQKIYFEQIEQRAEGKPFAYIIQKKEFFSRDFIVNPSVLIPRPETEELIEWILQENPKTNAVVDLCAGSGCIGITLALETNIKNLILIDISSEALKTAQANAQRLLTGTNTHMDFIQSDLFESLLNQTEQFDLIVTNPPYVLPNEYENLMNEVKNFEPKIALVTKDFSSLYARIAKQSFQKLRPSGLLYMETNPVCIKEAGQLLELAGFTQIEYKKDLSNKLRFLKALKPG